MTTNFKGSPSILLMFSGGVDSTAGLVHLLTETSKDIHVHHIVIKEVLAKQADKYFDVSSTPSIGHGESWKGGLDAVTKIIPYCRKNYRNFKFTSNLMDFTDVQSKFMSNFPPRGWMINYIINQNLSIDTVIWSVNSSDEIGKPWTLFGESGTEKNYDERRLYIEKVALFDVKRDIKMSKLFGPNDMNLNRQTMVKRYIPFELFKITWSCNFPPPPRPWPIECGKCNSCKEKIEVGLKVYGESKMKKLLIMS